MACYARFPNLNVIISNNKEKWADLIAVYQANCIFCSGFPWLIPKSIIHDPRLTLGVINFHNSHLPKYMGPNAFGWSMVHNLTHVGYCVHRMSEEFDTGNILFYETVDLDVNEDYQDLKKKMPAVFRGMVARAIERVLVDDPGVPQTGTPSQAPKFEAAFRWIDFQETARQIHNKVRAYYGERDHPLGAWAMVDGEKICITKTRFVREEEQHQQEGRLVIPMDLSAVMSDLLPQDDAQAAMMPAEVASLTSTTTSSTETSAAATSSTTPGTVISSQEANGTFWIQCGDMPLQVLQWHKVEA